MSPAPLCVKVFEQGVRTTPFVSPWFTMTITASMIVPFSNSTGGKSVIMSIEQLAKGLVFTGPEIGIKEGFEGFQFILNCWQIPHPLT